MVVVVARMDGDGRVMIGSTVMSTSAGNDRISLQTSKGIAASQGPLLVMIGMISGEIMDHHLLLDKWICCNQWFFWVGYSW